MSRTFDSARTSILIGLVGLAFIGCASITGKSAGRNIDDATITTAVKAKLAAADSLSTMTRIDVDTNNGVVYLTGNVDSERERVRAAELAHEVQGVYKVTNNLTVTGETSGRQSGG